MLPYGNRHCNSRRRSVRVVNAGAQCVDSCGGLRSCICSLSLCVCIADNPFRDIMDAFASAISDDECDDDHDGHVHIVGDEEIASEEVEPKKVRWCGASTTQCHCSALPLTSRLALTSLLSITPYHCFYVRACVIVCCCRGVVCVPRWCAQRKAPAAKPAAAKRAKPAAKARYEARSSSGDACEQCTHAHSHTLPRTARVCAHVTCGEFLIAPSPPYRTALQSGASKLAAGSVATEFRVYC